MVSRFSAPWSIIIMSIVIPEPILDALSLADPSWRDTLRRGLAALASAAPDYLPALANSDYLPTKGRIFAAFAQPIDMVRYVLVGEGPYPRPESATGVCFMDGAVGGLWSLEDDGGLSKPVNRATSLRNFMKMLLVADGQLTIENTSGAAIAQVARQARAEDAKMIQTLGQLQANLTGHGFLLLNASLVFRADVAPVKDAKAWHPFLITVLGALAERAKERQITPPTLVLWGKIAEQLHALEIAATFPKAVSEHPYNLSFIGNARMQDMFGPMRLLIK